MPGPFAPPLRCSVLLLAGATACTRVNPDYAPTNTPTNTTVETSSSGDSETSSGPPVTDASTGAPMSTRPAPMGTTTGTDTDQLDTTGLPDDPPPILFINFAGPVVSPGDDDATLNQSEVAGAFMGDALLPYGDGPKRTEVMQQLQEQWAPFHVEVTDQRPVRGDYAMVVVTPTNPIERGALGISSQDCDDMNPRSVGFTFASIDDELDALTTATAISHVAGRGYGLERVTGLDIMNPTISGQPGFADQCLPLVDLPACSHLAPCPPGAQNSFAELSERLALP